MNAVKCKDCPALVVWLQSRTSNKRIPVNLASVRETDRFYDYPRHVSHFGTCPVRVIADELESRPDRGPREGDIWVDLDTHKERAEGQTRFVEVLKPGIDSVYIRTVRKAGDRWSYAPRSRWTSTNRLRFNGEPGGYALHEPARLRRK